MSKKVTRYSFLGEAFERVSVKSKNGKPWIELTEEEQNEYVEEVFEKLSNTSASWYLNELTENILEGEETL